MVKIVALLGIVGASLIALPQTAWAVGSDENGVITECQIVAQNQLSRNHSTDGVCIRTAVDYIAGFAGNKDPSLNDKITSLVVKLARIVQDSDGCDVVNTESAEASRSVQSYSTDGRQRARLIEIAATIDDCQTEVTAAIGQNSSQG